MSRGTREVASVFNRTGGVRLLHSEELLGAFESRLHLASRLDVCVAWAGPCDPLDLIQKWVADGGKARMIVGLDGNATHPSALSVLRECAELRVGRKGPAGLFHYKFYLFRNSEENYCWIGSPNLTLGGFVNNLELACEFLDEGEGANWFDRIWQSLPRNSSQQIDQYVAQWRRQPIRSQAVPKSARLRVDHPISLITKPPNDWREFMLALGRCDEYWIERSDHFSVLSDEWSYVETIAAGHSIALKPDWRELNQGEARILLGLDDGNGAWGLLGSMRGAGIAKNVFLEGSSANLSVRRKIKEVLDPLVQDTTETEFIENAVRALQEIRSIPRFSTAIATRLIALARPDRGVSVNRESSPGLARLTGLPATYHLLGNETNYPKLLNWLFSQPWYQDAKPREPLPALAWRMRGALLDSFVYQYEEE